MSFKLPKINGSLPIGTRCIYFSCDTNYYFKYGRPLINSIVSQIPWVSVHCHLITFDKNIDIFKNKNVTTTFEIIDSNFIDSIPEDKSKTFSSNKYGFEPTTAITYYACARFLRSCEIFNETQSVLQIDCDSLLYNIFSKEEFDIATKNPLPTRKPKNPNRILASSLSLGTGKNGAEFRKELRNSLFSKIQTGMYWFIDQDVLEEIFNNNLDTLPVKWNNWNFKDPEAYFRTAKGNKKDAASFQEALLKWST